MIDSLDLYALIEPYIGFYKEYEELYRRYMEILDEFRIESIVDVGCGNGNFMLHLQEKYEDALGMDLSPAMVEIAKSKGVNAKNIEIKELSTKYDAMVAVGDVLNYMDRSTLAEFLSEVANHLNDGGVFVADINTHYGFSEVTAGSMVIDEGERFISIDAEFDGDRLVTDIVLFQKEGECYKRSKKSITQYYHSEREIESLTTLQLLEKVPTKMFSDEADKTILIFQKR